MVLLFTVHGFQSEGRRNDPQAGYILAFSDSDAQLLPMWVKNVGECSGNRIWPEDFQEIGGVVVLLNGEDKFMLSDGSDELNQPRRRSGPHVCCTHS